MLEERWYEFRKIRLNSEEARQLESLSVGMYGTG